jgi:hypothetical protein
MSMLTRRRELPWDLSRVVIDSVVGRGRVCPVIISTATTTTYSSFPEAWPSGLRHWS